MSCLHAAVLCLCSSAPSEALVLPLLRRGVRIFNGGALVALQPVLQLKLGARHLLFCLVSLLKQPYCVGLFEQTLPLQAPGYCWCCLHALYCTSLSGRCFRCRRQGFVSWPPYSPPLCNLMDSTAPCHLLSRNFGPQAFGPSRKGSHVRIVAQHTECKKTGNVPHDILSTNT